MDVIEVINFLNSQSGEFGDKCPYLLKTIDLTSVKTKIYT